MIIGQAGFKLTSSGALAVTPRSADIPASNLRIGGWAVTADGTAYATDATSALPAGTVLLEGLAFTVDGSLCVTTGAIASTATKIHGYAIRADGALHVNSGTVSGATLSQGVAYDATGAIFVSGLTVVIFNLPLADAGAGAVNTTPSSSSGSPTATFTRATAAWTKLSTGLWASVASGIARSSYLGATTAVGAYGGYLAEMAATQLVTPDASIRDMTDAAWVPGATITVAKTGTGIDGVVNSCSRLTFGAVSATNIILQTLTAAATSRTYSAWIRIVGSLAGAVKITQDGGATWTDITSQLTAANFVRVSLTASQLNAAFGIQGTGNGDVIFVDFNQFEAGAFATSPMATAGAARNIDVLTYASSGNLVGTAGSAYAEITTEQIGAIGAFCIVLGSSSGADRQLINLSQVGSKLGMYDGTTDAHLLAYTGSASVQKVASKWGGTTMNVYSAGVAGSSATFDGDMNAGASFGICYQPIGAASLNGTVKNVLIYNGALTDAQLQTLTT